MNRIMKISLMLVVMMFSITYSNAAPETVSRDEKVTFVTFENVKVGSILSLKDHSGTIMYSEIVNAAGKYSKQFDFTLLPNGDYTFELVNAYEVIVKPLTVSAKKVTFVEEKEYAFFKPVVSLKDDKVLISQLALDSKPLQVKLYYEQEDGNENLLYSNTFTSEELPIIEKVLSLSKNYRGNYRVVLSTNDHVYIENLKL